MQSLLLLFMKWIFVHAVKDSMLKSCQELLLFAKGKTCIFNLGRFLLPLPIVFISILSFHVVHTTVRENIHTSQTLSHKETDIYILSV